MTTDAQLREDLAVVSSGGQLRRMRTIVRLGRETPCVALMRERGLAKVELAAMSGVSMAQVERLRRGEFARVLVVDVVAVALVLGCAPAELIPGFGSRPRQRGAGAISDEEKHVQVAQQTLARLARERRVSQIKPKASSKAPSAGSGTANIDT